MNGISIMKRRALEFLLRMTEETELINRRVLQLLRERIRLLHLLHYHLGLQAQQQAQLPLLTQDPEVIRQAQEQQLLTNAQLLEVQRQLQDYTQQQTSLLRILRLHRTELTPEEIEPQQLLAQNQQVQGDMEHVLQQLAENEQHLATWRPRVNTPQREALILRILETVQPILGGNMRTVPPERFLRSIEEHGLSTDTESVVASSYIDRISDIAPELFSRRTIRPLLVVFHLLAAKWNLDVPYDNYSYHLISAIPLPIINALELLLVQLMEHSIDVLQEQYGAVVNFLHNLEPLE